MARVKLDLPAEFPFSTEVPIRISDINYGGHLGHDAILPLIHEARIKFLEHFGYSEVDIEGVVFLMADAVIIYKSQAYHGQTLKIEIGVRDFTRSACDFVYRLSNNETGTEIALVKTGMVFWDYRAEKTARVPEGFKAKFSIA